MANAGYSVSDYFDIEIQKECDNNEKDDLLKISRVVPFKLEDFIILLCWMTLKRQDIIQDYLTC